MTQLLPGGEPRLPDLDASGPPAWAGRPGLRGALPLLGPAFVAAVAYVDPGNVATNTAAGAQYGTMLVWVVVVSNVLAVLVQYLSAKLGVATGQGLARNCRDRLPAPVTVGLWLQAELVAMATDLAEVLGGALALNLLFGLPLFAGGLVTGVVAFGMLALTGRGARPYEQVVIGLLSVVLGGFLVDLFWAGPDFTDVASGLVPRLAGSDALLLSSGILGATVMPHVIYLHASLTGQRARRLDPAGRRALLNAQRIDIPVAMSIAGMVNLALLVLAATLFAGTDVDTIEGAYAGVGDELGTLAATAFAFALLASGLAASSVGTYSGQVVMQGFLQRTVPLTLRRAVTLAPALVVLALGIEPTRALVLSQVVLSFGIPFALVPLVLLTSRVSVMGEYVNRRRTTWTAGVVALLIVGLNLVLLVRPLL